MRMRWRTFVRSPTRGRGPDIHVYVYRVRACVRACGGVPARSRGERPPGAAYSNDTVRCRAARILRLCSYIYPLRCIYTPGVIKPGNI